LGPSQGTLAFLKPAVLCQLGETDFKNTERCAVAGHAGIFETSGACSIDLKKTGLSVVAGHAGILLKPAVAALVPTILREPETLPKRGMHTIYKHQKRYLFQRFRKHPTKCHLWARRHL
jgi:hypothetical protein